MLDIMGIKQVPTDRALMLIRKPVTEVFEAFINSEITTKFWFTKSTDRLEEGKIIEEWKDGEEVPKDSPNENGIF
jgi:uncharacterized protein YndB with AHSA1/START domain